MIILVLYNPAIIIMKLFIKMRLAFRFFIKISRNKWFLPKMIRNFTI